MKHDVLLIGGSGFVGKAITQQLQTKGYSVLIPSRRYSAIRDLRLLPSVTLIEADVNDRKTIINLLSDLKPDRKSTRLNSSHVSESRMPSSA